MCINYSSGIFFAKNVAVELLNVVLKSGYSYNSDVKFARQLLAKV